MTAKKAAEILKDHHKGKMSLKLGDLFKAEQIALESLQLNLKMRHSHHHFDLLILPSEEPE